MAVSQRRKLVKVTRDTRDKLELSDPTVAALAFRKDRFFLFTTREPAEEDVSALAVGRDVFNEKPADAGVAVGPQDAVSGAMLPRGVVLHTSLGEIWLKLVRQSWHCTGSLLANGRLALRWLSTCDCLRGAVLVSMCD